MFWLDDYIRTDDFEHVREVIRAFEDARTDTPEILEQATRILGAPLERRIVVPEVRVHATNVGYVIYEPPTQQQPF